MEQFLRGQLRTNALQLLGTASGGYISNGYSYLTDAGPVFVKLCSHNHAQAMYEGERASLEALIQTDSVRVPKPVKLVEYVSDNAWMLVMEHLNIRRLKNYQAVLGNQVARLHLHNLLQLRKSARDSSHIGRAEQSLEVTGVSSGHVDKFGFPCNTSCGLYPTSNDWMVDWVEFYCRQKLGEQVALVEKTYGDREAAELWPLLQRRVPALFEGVEVSPSLLHGDLWYGNTGEDSNGPVVYDPASFYGHHEFDLAFEEEEGFTKQFFDAYHAVIPKAPGFAGRHRLYQLFRALNHWNHFGGEYRAQAILLMKELVKDL